MKLKVKVIPRAKKERIEQFGEGIKVYLTKPPLKGEANERLREVLACHFCTKKRNVKILKGEKQREKIVQISDK